MRRDDLTRTTFLEHPVPEPGVGEALLRVDRVGVTANNVTYARVGETMRYWDFFPAEEGWGRVPLWGFADVERSNVEGVEVGERVYGYLPTSSHLIIRPRVSSGGIRDVSDHRAHLPAPYNVYAKTSTDPSYRPDQEDLQVLYRPLFITSFMLDDYLGEKDFFGAEVMLVSSASSKTAYGAAFCMGLRPRRPELIGLTSPQNVAFTEGLGCYDAVMGYDDLTRLRPAVATLYADLSGSPELREIVHRRFEKLVHHSIIGMTHEDAELQERHELPGPEPVFFFAPDQMLKRRQDWGPGGIEKRHRAAWAEFAPVVKNWVEVTVGHGRDGLRAAWLEVLAGRVDPRIGHVVAL
ncbi:MAG: DUF2855 family protein [Actinomycetota bacterium]|nr:DUF2855 family protein [Actinomycetota bacterium]